MPPIPHQGYADPRKHNECKTVEPTFRRPRNPVKLSVMRFPCGVLGGMNATIAMDDAASAIYVEFTDQQAA